MIKSEGERDERMKGSAGGNVAHMALMPVVVLKMEYADRTRRRLKVESRRSRCRDQTMI